MSWVLPRPCHCERLVFGLWLAQPWIKWIVQWLWKGCGLGGGWVVGASLCEDKFMCARVCACVSVSVSEGSAQSWMQRERMTVSPWVNITKWIYSRTVQLVSVVVAVAVITEWSQNKNVTLFCVSDIKMKQTAKVKSGIFFYFEGLHLTTHKQYMSNWVM